MSLREAGKPTEARRLFPQLADGPWQPRFLGLPAQARWQCKDAERLVRCRP